eukprot:3842507-Heterocapsa_arctica.AAC.1
MRLVPPSATTAAPPAATPADPSSATPAATPAVPPEAIPAATPAPAAPAAARGDSKLSPNPGVLFLRTALVDS